jgi:type II secretion system protein N
MSALAATRPGLWRRRWLLAASAVFGTFTFTAFLVASFPYDDSVSSILAPFQLKLVYRAQRMSPPLGARLESVRLVSVANSHDQLVLESPNVTLVPTLGSLFLGRPGIRVYAELFGGIVRATVRPRSGAVNLSFDLSGLSLVRIDPLRQLGASLSGAVAAAGSAELRNPSISASTGHFTLDCKEVAVQIVNGLPPVRLGAVTGKLAFDSGKVSLDRVDANGADLTLKATGTIQLAQDLPDSAVELRVSLKPTPSGSAHFAFFLNLLPHPPAAGPYTVEGQLGAPSIS